MPTLALSLSCLGDTTVTCVLTTPRYDQIEEEVAEFMGTEEAISYSDSATTISSAIPAFAKKGDLTIVDQVRDKHREGEGIVGRRSAKIGLVSIYTTFSCCSIGQYVVLRMRIIHHRHARPRFKERSVLD